MQILRPQNILNQLRKSKMRLIYSYSLFLILLNNVCSLAQVTPITQLDSAFYYNNNKFLILRFFISKGNVDSCRECYSTEKINEAIMQCQNIKELQLDGVKLTHFPSAIYKLELLETLNLSNNNLKKFPDSIFLLEKLRYLTIFDNPIKSIPDRYFNSTNITVLDVGGLSIKCLPKKISKVKHLRYLDVSFNRNIKLPRSLSKLDSLKTIRIHGCFYKKLPTVIYNIKPLKDLVATGNLFNCKEVESILKIEDFRCD